MLSQSEAEKIRAEILEATGSDKIVWPRDMEIVCSKLESFWRSRLKPED